MQIMIGYNQSSSSELAVKINKYLKDKGYKTWIDLEEMHTCQLLVKMAEAVESSDLVLVLVTNEYCNSINCNKECNYASNQKKKIIPIKVTNWYNPKGLVGFVLADLIYVDFSKNGFQISFQSLINQINHVINIETQR